MPKSKNAPALFELYGKARDTEPVNSTDGADFRNRTPVAESASAFRATLSSLARSIGGLGRSDPSASGPTRLPRETGSGAVAVGGGTLELSVPWWAVWVTVASLTLLVVLVFVAGQWLGRQAGVADGRKLEREEIQRTAMDEIELARRSKPVEGLFTGIGAASPIRRSEQDRVDGQGRADFRRGGGLADSGQQVAGGVERSSHAPAPLASRTRNESIRRRKATADVSPWVKGLSYIVVQHFASNLREEAEEVQAYLAERNVITEIVQDRRGGYRLITTEGFNYKDAEEKQLCKQLQERVRRLGRAYHKVSNGRYKLEGYVATLTRESW